MNAYRYNAKSREDRKFNNCGTEKNPNGINFYASNLDYASKYKIVYFEDGSINYECELSTVELDISNLFDMASNFKTLASYRAYINNEIGQQMVDYSRNLNKATKLSEKKMWEKNISSLKDREAELIAALISNEFQSLSDFSNQQMLIDELQSLGFSGYTTLNEVAIF